MSDYYFENTDDNSEAIDFTEKSPIHPDYLDFLPLFSYKYLDFGKTKFHFAQPEFADDITYYFEKLKKYSGLTLSQLNEQHYSEHFKLNDPNKFEQELIEQVYNKKLTPQNLPLIGHFALYTNKEETGKRSPRVFFTLEDNATIYIILYDPFHNIHGLKLS